MAAEESSQGAALGPDISEPAAGNASAEREFPNLDDVLGEFMEALCVVAMVHHTLSGVTENASDEVGSCAVALRHGFQLLSDVYERFDEGLVGLANTDDDQSDDEEQRVNAAADDEAGGVRADITAEDLARRFAIPELHPGYEAAIFAQAQRLDELSSVLGCARLALRVSNDEVDITGALATVHRALPGIVEELASSSLHERAVEWRLKH